MKNSMVIIAFWATLMGQVTGQPVDVCVYGATSSGIIAAYTAQKMGKSVVLLEPGRHIGGLTTGGLGQTDIGNKYAITGLARDYYRRIGRHYGRLEQWTFEPKVAKAIFMDYLREVNLTVTLGQRLREVSVRDGAIAAIVLENGATIQAKMFIDATYEGDLMAKSGVDFTVGRESNAQYQETWNGVQMLDKHQFPEGIDPYKIPGNPASGLLWGISPTPVAATGSGDHRLQAYNFRLCLTDSVPNQMPITQPVDYDPGKYELLLRYIDAKKPHELNWALMHIQPMPGRKTDINNSGPFSTDMIGENYDYPNGSYAVREAIVAKHENYIKGLLYFLGHDPRVPEHLRREMQQYGYPKDEYTDNNHFSPQLYVREARRMVSDYVMTQHHCEGKTTAPDGIGMAAYTMDSHNCQRVVAIKNGMPMVMNEGDVQQGLGGLPPYPISYRAIIPKKGQINNLLVPVCMSASHIAYGSIRMEPVFMVLGQSAAVAACMAIDGKTTVHQVNVAALQKELKDNPLANNTAPEILVDNADSNALLIRGKWQLVPKGRGRYGKHYLQTSPRAGLAQAVVFSPGIRTSRKYSLYLYMPPVEEGTRQLRVYVWQGQKRKAVDVSINPELSDWVALGQFALNARQQNRVEITTEGASGKVVVDALLVRPE